MFHLFDPDSDYTVTSGTSLPHWYQPGATYFVTFRTDDSIPHRVSHEWHARKNRWLASHGVTMSSENWKEQFAALPREQRRQFHDHFSRQYLEYLDRSWGACVLKQSRLSRIVADSLLYFDGKRYQMGDFVVMPNHVHLLVSLLGATDIVKQCTSWKHYTARKINTLLATSGRFWHAESFDHLVRSSRQFCAIQRYIADNAKHLADGEYHLHRLAENL